MKQLKIFADNFSESPREWDNLGVIAYKSSRYTLGEEEIDDPIDWLCQKLGYDDLEEYNETNNIDLDYNNSTFESLEAEFFDHYIALPVYIYDHSGITINTAPFSCPWDSGQIGYIYIPEEKTTEINSFPRNWLNGRSKEEAAKDVLKGEIETFDDYIRGEVFGFRVEEMIKCNSCEGVQIEVIDSCGGFYGTDFMNNGMRDYIPEEMEEQLKDYDFDAIEFSSY